MKIIAHRGFWLKREEQNSAGAFIRALNNGFGIELDIRDCCGKLVLSHDPPRGAEPEVAGIFKKFSQVDNFRKVQFAINIKSDGLEESIAGIIDKFRLNNNSFVFDMTVPSMSCFARFGRNIALATRHSDIEPHPVLYSQAKWVWMDSLNKEWIKVADMAGHFKKGKKVVLVSPELHRRDFKKIWNRYLLIPANIREQIYLCTDYPQEADVFFNRGD